MIIPLVLALTLGGVFPYPTKITTLKNGLTVVRVPMDSPGLVAFYTVVRVGSRNEVEPGHTGFAHFFEHMMFRGTKRFPEGSRGAVLGKLGFNGNAFTGDDATVYLSNGPSSGLETLIDLEADRFKNLDYAEPAFQTEAKAVLGEYQKNASNPSLKIEETTLGTAFTVHPYRHTTLGFFEDIVAMPTRYAYSKTFFARWYTPDNAVIVVAGEFDDAKLMGWIEKHFGPWSGKAAKIVIPVEPPQTAPRAAALSWPTPTLPRIGMAWHSPAASPKTMDAAVQAVLSAYLVGETSPLHKSLVLEQQLVERLSSFYDHHRDPCFFGIDARLKVEGHRAAVSTAILGAISELSSGKVDLKRLEDIKSHLRYGVVMDLETPSQVAETVAWNVGVFGTADAIDSLYGNVAKVSAKDLTAFSKKFLVDSNRTTLTFTVELKEKP